MAKTCINAGHLRHKMTLQRVTRTSDGAGGFTQSWGSDETVWAKIEPASGREVFRAQQLETPVTHKITCRYNANITTAARLIYDNRVFNIQEVLNPLERNAIMEVLAIEGLDD